MKLTKEQFHTIAPKRTEHKFVNHYLYRENENCFILKDKVNIFIYIILVIPCIILTLGICLWDGGLKAFVFPVRTVREDKIYDYHTSYKYVKEIYEKKA